MQWARIRAMLAAVRHVLRKQRERKRKGKIKRNERTHMHFSIPFLRCPFQRLCILYGHILAMRDIHICMDTYSVQHIENESSNRPTDRYSDRV